jgi:antitoxin (DNA-binding transcriptional repressor) of toxin-antitoxin stability system
MIFLSHIDKTGHSDYIVHLDNNPSSKGIQNMHQTFTLTEAKAKFSEIINCVLFRREKFMTTKKGKAVAMVSPINQKHGAGSGEGLIRAKGTLAQMDRLVDEMVEEIYEARSQETDRKVRL